MIESQAGLLRRIDGQIQTADRTTARAIWWRAATEEDYIRERTIDIYIARRT